MKNTMNWLKRLSTQLWACERGSVEGEPPEPSADPPSDPPQDPPSDPPKDPPSGDNIVWPERWREGMAGQNDDEGKRLTRLGRFDSPGKIFDSYLELEEKYKQSDIRTPFPADGKDDAKTKWREAYAIPTEPVGYFDGVPDGLVIGEDDEAGMLTLAEAMHAVNASPEVTHAAMGAYYKVLQDSIAERVGDDNDYKLEMTKHLEGHWPGAEMARNMNDLDSWLGGAPGDVKNKLLSARMPNGKPLGSDPDVIKFFVGEMRTLHPVDIITGLGPGDPQLALHDEIAKIEERIRTDNAAYRKDKVMNDRYLTLISARDKQQVKEQIAR